jgi:hypothetical protein
MRIMPLGGKHAVGAHAVALVDDGDYQYLAQWRWKAKPNGSYNNTYAVRVEKGADGRWHDIRMHREVLGYSGQQDIDHINHCGTDNRRSNLRVVTRSENLLNQRLIAQAYDCPQCGVHVRRTTAASGARIVPCQACRTNADRARRVAYERTRPRLVREPTVRQCAHCIEPFFGYAKKHRFCTEACRKSAKRARQIAMGCLPPSQTAACQRERRAIRNLRVLVGPSGSSGVANRRNRVAPGGP